MRLFYAKPPVRSIGAIIAAACIATGLAFAAPPSAIERMEAAHQATRLSQSRFEARLTIVGSGTTRTRELRGLTKSMSEPEGYGRSFAFLAPDDIKGVATLTIERAEGKDDLWVYLPSQRKVRRLVTSNRRDAWIGSDFSYGDILGHKVSDWSHAVLRSEKINGEACDVIESLPASKTVLRDTGYGRRISWVRRSDNALIKTEFYDAKAKLLKTMTASEFKPIAGQPGRLQPMRIEIVSAKRKGQSSLVLTSLDTSDPISDDAFTVDAISP